MRNKNFILLIIYVLVVVFIAEMIGFQSISLFGIKFNFLPLVFALLITMTLAAKVFRKGLLKSIYSEENIKFCSNYLIIIMLPLIARYGADVAPKLKEILNLGWVFVLQELGHLGTILLGLPVALLLRLKREAIGATLGIGREGELAYITEAYTLDSAEGRGILSQYIFGTLFGALFFSLIPPIFLKLGFSPESLSMASGMGSTGMMAAATSSLIAELPEEVEMIKAYSSASQLLTAIFGTFTMLLLAVPFQRFLYKLLARGEKNASK